MTHEISEVENATRLRWQSIVDLANDTLLGKYPGKRVVFAPGSKVMFHADVTSVPSLITMYLHLGRPVSRRDANGRVMPSLFSVDDVVKITIFADRDL